MFTISIILLSLYYIFKPREPKEQPYKEPKEPRQTLIRANLIDDYEKHQVYMSNKEFKDLEKRKEYEDRCMIQN